MVDAELSTQEALELGAGFSESQRQKAVLHAWLAWQRRPGLPYGLALTDHYSQYNSPAAVAFVSWFRCVFETEMDVS